MVLVKFDTGQRLSLKDGSSGSIFEPSSSERAEQQTKSDNFDRSEGEVVEMEVTKRRRKQKQRREDTAVPDKGQERPCTCRLARAVNMAGSPVTMEWTEGTTSCHTTPSVASISLEPKRALSDFA
jgi:hypothetical protein